MHWHITCATVLQLFSHVCTDSHHCASSTGVFTQTLRNAISNAFCCFPGKDFYKKHAQHEGGSRCRLALHNPLQFLAYGGWFKKKWIWMVWKSIHPGPQRINYLFLVICCVLPWLYPPVLLWRHALHRLYRSEQASVLAFCMSENKDFNSITFFVWTITSDRACIFNEGNSSFTYGNKRTENPMQP